MKHGGVFPNNAGNGYFVADLGIMLKNHYNQSIGTDNNNNNNNESTAFPPETKKQQHQQQQQQVLPRSMKLSEPQLQDLLKIIPCRRRRIHSPSYNSNGTTTTTTTAAATQVLLSLVPKECDLRKLGIQANQNNDPSSALLQLADAYRFGLLGVVPDRYRASTLYACAAWGIKELDFEEQQQQQPLTLRFAYPMGTPEAMCAHAMDIWEHEGGLLGPDVTTTTTTMSFTQAMQIVQDHSNHRLQASLATIIFFVAHSLRRGWISPLALELGQALQGNRRTVELFLPDSLYFLCLLNDPESTSPLSITVD